MSIERTQWGCGEQAMVNTHTHTYTHTVSHDTQGGWSPTKGSDAILTHVSFALPLIKLMGYEHREDEVGVGGAGNGKHIHTHSPSLYTGWRQYCVRSLLETIYTLSVTRNTVCVCACVCVCVIASSPTPLRPPDVHSPLI